jgi:hypothetical protein
LKSLGLGTLLLLRHARPAWLDLDQSALLTSPRS